MTLPPGKRQRRLILSDDDDEPVVKTRRAPPRLPSRPVRIPPDQQAVNQNGSPKGRKAKVPANLSPNPSPGKRHKGPSKEKESKSLHTFFGRATEEQRWARKDKTPPVVIEDGEVGDDIEDDSHDEIFAQLSDGQGDENKLLGQRTIAEPNSRHETLKGSAITFSSNRKFAKPSKSATKEVNAVFRHDDELLRRPWAERFTPTSLEELAVHKKKVADVQNWLTAVLQGRDRRVCDYRLRTCRVLH
jgi:cell cycle checkpoint protein